MSVYNASPFAPTPQMLQAGVNFYAFGSKKQGAPTTRMLVTSVSANGSNIATVGVKILEGPIPIIGNLVSIIGTQTAAAYNVTNVALTNVVIDSTTGIGTITFPCTTGSLAVTADSGTALVPIAEVAEALTNNSSSVQAAIPSPSGATENQMEITWQTFYTSQPAGITATLQGSLEDKDSEYFTLDTSTSVAGEIRNILVGAVNFVRVRITGLGGAAPAGIIKLSI